MESRSSQQDVGARPDDDERRGAEQLNLEFCPRISINVAVQDPGGIPERARNLTESKVRAKVEHVFSVMKQIFVWTKVRYRELAKNTNWFSITCGLTDLYLARRHLLVGV